MTESIAGAAPEDGALPYAGLRVLDCSNGVPGQFATRILAALGADVLLLEPPGGTVTRRHPPFRDTDETAESLTFWHLNLGKESLALDWHSALGRSLLGDVISDGVDVVVAGFDRDIRAVLRDFPDTLAVEIDDFGSTGPFTSWSGSELIHQALSGTMFQTGNPEREPLYGIDNRAYYATGIATYISIAAQLVGCRITPRTGNADPVEVTVSETAAAMGQNEVTTYWYNGTWSTRGRYAGLIGRLQCRDGWVVVFGLSHWPEICRAFGSVELTDDPRFASTSARLKHWDTALGLLQEHAHQLSSRAVVALAQADGAMVESINTLDDVVGLDHLAERRFWRTIATPGGERRALGPLFRVGGDRPLWRVGQAPAYNGALGLVLDRLGVSKAQRRQYRTAGVLG